ncbi:hypothetical protein BH23ACT5_BH23ACT5_09100 [soil metagenome]
MDVEQVPAHKWEAWIESNQGVIVDVREPEEWALGTLPGSVELTLSDLAGSLATLDPATPTLVVCRSGSRSQHAAWFLAASGFTHVANLAGGLVELGMQP